jgi:hypothetical protein
MQQQHSLDTSDIYIHSLPLKEVFRDEEVWEGVKDKVICRKLLEEAMENSKTNKY